MNKQESSQWMCWMSLALFVVVFIFGIVPVWKVWSQCLISKSQWKQAEFNKKIALKNSQTKILLAQWDAQADIERAKGIAEANRIIAKSKRNS